MKTNDLTGVALDWAVAKCEGKNWGAVESFIAYHEDGDMNYSTDWAQGGPIIEREYIELVGFCSSVIWEAVFPGRGEDAVVQYGPTPLIAAMRCYVASKLGNKVDVPPELT